MPDAWRNSSGRENMNDFGKVVNILSQIWCSRNDCYYSRINRNPYGMIQKASRMIKNV